ncbi:MAG: hypothetical protein M1815_002200 [Lichina confinis]|nr:MAG: hypothetical protein M1815_002200 [Lichina confinis]
MATPLDQIKCLPSQTGDAAQDTEVPKISITPTDRKNAVLKKLRAPPLTHGWEFWHDRHVPASTTPSISTPGEKPNTYEANLAKLIDINNVQTFWETFNNFPLDSLVMRDSVHLFKRTVKPVWEDQRNVRGGSWTFRVNKADAAEFWKCMQLMAIGETLQEVVEQGDDICGVSLSIRFNSHMLSVWNRDGANQKSIDAILAVILAELPDNLKPSPQNYYYRKHSEHKGFNSKT